MSKQAWESVHREMPELAELVALHSLFLLHHHLTPEPCLSLMLTSMAVNTL
jgi:hypothetical protein